MTDRITLADLAAELQMDRSALRKAVVKKGLDTHRVRTVASRGQAMLALDKGDADIMRRQYAWRLEG